MGIKDFEPAVAAALPGVVALVPKEPAARLGRWQPKNHRPRGTRVQSALDEIGDLLAERLLGALELAVDDLTVDIPADLLAGLVPSSVTRFGIVSAGEASPTGQAVGILEHLHPGAADLVVELVEALQHKASVPDASGDEAEIAAQHGAAYLALAVVVATAVLHALGTAVASATPAIVGVALGTAAIVLPKAPKPSGYAAAVLAKRRAEYKIPRHSSTAAAVTDHRFWLTEDPLPVESVPGDTDFAGNGLVVAVPGGVVIRTGAAEGSQRMSVDVLAEAPAAVTAAGWDEVVDISWTAREGGARLSGTRGRWESPPWPGDYRLRVHARDRDTPDDTAFHLILWRAPAEPETVHKKTDRLGHRLRGEAEPPVVVEPGDEYRWISKTSLSEAATITVVRGLTADEVVAGLGGDPTAPTSIEAITAQPPSGYVVLLTVLAVEDDVVLAVEENGFQGADDVLLRDLSRNGKAASLYWNVNGRFQLTFAERGELLAMGNPAYDPGVPHTEGLDFGGLHRTAKGMVALARFTGRGLTEPDLAAMYAGDRVYLLAQ